MNDIFSSIHVEYQYTLSMESMFNLRPFSEKMENYEISIFVPNSQNLEFIISLIHVWYWIINDLTNDVSVMVWYTREFKSSAPTINFLENFRKRVVIFYTEKSEDYQNTYPRSSNICLAMFFSQSWYKMVIYHMENRVEWFWVKNKDSWYLKN